MSIPPKIKTSVIIPTFDRAKLIGYTLDSLIELNSKDFEIIVIDDGSTDNTEEIVKLNYPTVRYFKQINSGAPAARNLGLKESKGEYILFLDSDDFLEKDFFISKNAAFELDTRLDGVYGNFDFFNSIGSYRVEDEVPRYSNYPIYEDGNEDKILNNLLGGWYIHPCAILWKKSFLEMIGGFRVDLVINQDVDLVFRALLAGGKMIGVMGPRGMIREHENDRVGVIAKNPEKINQIFHLREWFRDELMKKNKWNEVYANSMASFSFDVWSMYRISMPEEAKSFLLFSKLLNPNLKLKGGLGLRVLSKILGNERAVIFKQTFAF